MNARITNEYVTSLRLVDGDVGPDTIEKYPVGSSVCHVKMPDTFGIVVEHPKVEFGEIVSVLWSVYRHEMIRITSNGSIGISTMAPTTRIR